MWSKIKSFLAGVREELRHVNWPSRSEAIYLTIVVVVGALALAFFLGAFDYLFEYLLKLILLKHA
jgi:preprotein translocase SecE subunit